MSPSKAISEPSSNTLPLPLTVPAGTVADRLSRVTADMSSRLPEAARLTVVSRGSRSASPSANPSASRDRSNPIDDVASARPLGRLASTVVERSSAEMPEIANSSASIVTVPIGARRVPASVTFSCRSDQSASGRIEVNSVEAPAVKLRSPLNSPVAARDPLADTRPAAASSPSVSRERLPSSPRVPSTSTITSPATKGWISDGIRPAMSERIDRLNTRPSFARSMLALPDADARSPTVAARSASKASSVPSPCKLIDTGVSSGQPAKPAIRPSRGSSTDRSKVRRPPETKDAFRPIWPGGPSSRSMVRSVRRPSDGSPSWASPETENAIGSPTRSVGSSTRSTASRSSSMSKGSDGGSSGVGSSGAAEVDGAGWRSMATVPASRLTT